MDNTNCNKWIIRKKENINLGHMWRGSARSWRGSWSECIQNTCVYLWNAQRINANTYFKINQTSKNEFVGGTLLNQTIASAGIMSSLPPSTCLHGLFSWNFSKAIKNLQHAHKQCGIVWLSPLSAENSTWQCSLYYWSLIISPLFSVSPGRWETTLFFLVSWLPWVILDTKYSPN